MPLPIRRSHQGGVRGSGRGLQTQRGFPDAQQGAGAQGCGAFVEVGAVDGGAVGGAQVGDGDRAVRFDCHGAVQAGDVRVVQGDVGVGGAADADLAAVQQVHAAGVGAGDDAEACGAVGQAVCGGGARGLEGEHRAVDERRLAERRALGIEAFGPGVQHDGAIAAARAADVRTRAGHGGGEGAATAARAVPAGAVTSTSQARVGWPLRGPRTVSRICIAVNGPFCRDPTGGPLAPPTTPEHVGTYKSQVHVATRAARPHRFVLDASSHLPLTMRPPTAVQ